MPREETVVVSWQPLLVMYLLVVYLLLYIYLCCGGPHLAQKREEEIERVKREERGGRGKRKKRWGDVLLFCVYCSTLTLIWFSLQYTHNVDVIIEFFVDTHHFIYGFQIAEFVGVKWTALDLCGC